MRTEPTVQLSADNVEATTDGKTRLEGDVTLRYQDTRIRAPLVEYDRETGEARTEGGAEFANARYAIGADRAAVDLDASTARFEGAEFTLYERGARGQAEHIDLADDLSVSMDRVRYTTCAQPSRGWTLKASHITLDPQEGLGTASHARLNFLGVPVLYAPYFYFPIDDRRRTGFLMPNIGDSAETGFDISTPFYWNLGSWYDALITPRYMARRGSQLQAEGRYLLDNGRGELRYEYLPNDETLQIRRSLFGFEHQGVLSDRWEIAADFTEVSDRGYFEDLGTTLDLAAISHLEREARIAYQAPAWFSSVLTVEDYQTIDRTVAPADEPYRRLPRLQLNALSPNDWNQMRVGLATEYVNFERDNAVEGTRLDLKPFVRLRHDAVGWFVASQVDYRYTAYDLRDRNDGRPTTITRELPSASVDAGLRFDRIAKAGLVQTLEPRIYYLYTPYRDQDAIPLFETDDPDFSFVQLFSRNRFSGVDRIADANQVTAAFTTRILELATGKTRFEAALGQIYRLQPSEVTLPDEPGTAGRDNSDIVGTLRWLPVDWLRLGVGAQWDPARTQLNRANTSIKFRPRPGYRFDLGYRFRRDLLEQTDLVVQLPLNQTWSVVGRWNYALDDASTREAVIGAEYKACCWTGRVAWRRYIANTRGEFNTSVYLQLELTGLSRIGAGIKEFLPD
ncbi:LPS assembly protein LptD [uncultured Abyssibacter sp.]|uniref:LPS-assembly protein LptD n=1 Tax=uncultured Abyssibacter sp. TaxID=2320202 RepID=UPI0032B22076